MSVPLGGGEFDVLHDAVCFGACLLPVKRLYACSHDYCLRLSFIMLYKKIKGRRPKAHHERRQSGAFGLSGVCFLMMINI